MGFVIYFSIVLVLYALINYYIIHRGFQAFSPDSTIRTWIIVCIVVFASSFIAGRFLERVSVNWFTATLIWIGSFWLAILVYLLLQILVIDLFKGLNALIAFFPDFITSNPEKTKRTIGIIVLIITLVIVGIGHLNTWFPAVRELELKIDKDGGKLQNLHIVTLSDIHLGTTIEKRHMSGIVKKVNALNPDIILIPGDIIDEDITPVIHSNVGEKLTSLKSKYGVYAVTGNHEYIGGVYKAKKYLTDHHINLLNDTAILIDESFYLVGREDLTINQFTNQKRKKLKDIVSEVDTSKPTILLDHQPFKLQQAELNGIDLQLSGHTHHGQLWPFNYIAKMVFELSWGYEQKGNTHYYISSGVGGWGPPIRTVNRPEIISINLKFNNQ
ncbi:MAG: metallophosphoesterase [Candidatus Heimdallarchaeota archaeon]|nr:metallophosphoesterase [Candidatus Heimdallarchaeota archaeon]